MTNKLIPLPSADLMLESGVPALLELVRPEWQARSLIERVRRLMHVDPSSACQRLLNAAIHDLKEKIKVAGLDIAAEAAKQNGLPPIGKSDDVDNYSTSKLLDLVYRIGLVSRPEWRRLHRCYEIRRDLEHEDDEYEAGVEDCIYIFKTCVEVVLAKDPIHILRVSDVKDLVEQAVAVAPSNELLEDYGHAPQPRQEEIAKFLVSVASDGNQSDIVQQNAYTTLSAIAPFTHNSVKIEIAKQVQDKIKRGGLDRRLARVSSAAGVFPYLKQNTRTDFFQGILDQMEKVGNHWTAHAEHGELLRSFAEFGGLEFCPPQIRRPILRWLVLLYLGTQGGHTSYGNVRHVFYSNTGAPLAAEIIKRSARQIRQDLQDLRDDKEIRIRLKDQHIARRYETLLDLVDASGAAP